MLVNQMQIQINPRMSLLFALNKYQILIIAVAVLAAALVLTITMNTSITLPEPVDGDLTHSIEVLTSPSEIDGLNRKTPYLPPKITEQELVHAKIKQGVVYVLGASNAPEIKGQVIFSTDYPPSKYKITQPGPFDYITEIYVTDKEFNQYRSWADENLVPKGVDHDSDSYYFEYDGEIIIMNFVDTVMRQGN